MKLWLLVFSEKQEEKTHEKLYIELDSIVNFFKLTGAVSMFKGDRNKVMCLKPNTLFLVVHLKILFIFK